MSSRYAAVSLSVLLLLMGGFVHGLCSERWAPSGALEEAAERVERVPLDLGDWHGQADEADTEAFEQTGARSYWIRTYTHRHNGASVLAILMCGRPGRMAVHTPESCYGGAGYSMTGAATRFQAEAGKAVFWTAALTKPAGEAGELRLFWSWNGGTGWEAPDSPRWQFRSRPFLYKLYVAHGAPGRAPRPAEDAASDFLHMLLPELERTLFPEVQSARN